MSVTLRYFCVVAVVLCGCATHQTVHESNTLEIIGIGREIVETASIYSVNGQVVRELALGHQRISLEAVRRIGMVEMKLVNLSRVGVFLYAHCGEK